MDETDGQASTKALRYGKRHLPYRSKRLTWMVQFAASAVWGAGVCHVGVAGDAGARLCSAYAVGCGLAAGAMSIVLVRRATTRSETTGKRVRRGVRWRFLLRVRWPIAVMRQPAGLSSAASGALVMVIYWTGLGFDESVSRENSG